MQMILADEELKKKRFEQNKSTSFWRAFDIFGIIIIIFGEESGLLLFFSTANVLLFFRKEFFYEFSSFIPRKSEKIQL